MSHFQNFLLFVLEKIRAQTKTQWELTTTNYSYGRTAIFAWKATKLFARGFGWLLDITAKTLLASVFVAVLLFAGYLVAQAIMPQSFDFKPKAQFIARPTQHTVSPTEHQHEIRSMLERKNATPQEQVATHASQRSVPLHGAVSVLLLSDIDAPLLQTHSAILILRRNIEDIDPATMAITAGVGVEEEISSPQSQDPLNGLSLERTDKTWAGRALPLSSVRQIVAQYNWNLEKAVRIIFCESGRNPRVVNDNPNTRDYSVGLFQINLFQSLEAIRPSEEWLKNPINNVNYAYRLYQQFGWTPWKQCAARADDAMRN